MVAVVIRFEVVVVAMMCGCGGVSVCVGVREGYLGVTSMGGRGFGVETLCGREIFQGMVRRWVFLWWLVIPCGGRFCFSGPYLLSFTLGGVLGALKMGVLRAEQLHFLI